MLSEIGGYFGIETYGAQPYYKSAIYLNSARNALRYVILAYDIREIFVPYYTCPIVWEVIKSEQCKVKFYEIGRDFLPVTEFPEEAFVLINNYFGVCHTYIRLLTKKYKNLLIDNAQGFYDEPMGLASIYSPRKFFGLPDGGILICKKKLGTDFEKDISYERMSHLLKRYDLDASAGYSDFKANEDGLSNQPIRKMSNLTHALMGNINYDTVKQKRKKF